MLAHAAAIRELRGADVDAVGAERDRLAGRSEGDREAGAPSESEGGRADAEGGLRSAAFEPADGAGCHLRGRRRTENF